MAENFSQQTVPRTSKFHLIVIFCSLFLDFSGEIKCIKIKY